MTEQTDKLTDKQRAWLERYLSCLNGTEAARGVYDTEDYQTLRRIGSQNLGTPYIRDEINRRLKETLPDAQAVLGRLAEIAFSNPAQYLNADGTLDLDRLVANERTFLVKGVSPVRGGLRWEFEDRMTALRLLGRYYELFNTSDVRVTVEHDAPTLDDLSSLMQQLTAAQDQESGATE